MQRRYFNLGLETKDPERKLALYQHSYEIGKLALDVTITDDDSEDLWGLLETRPFMRAQLMLSITRWDLGQHDEAVRNYQELIQLNPGDNQGIRYRLLDALLVLGRDQEASELHRLCG